MIDKLLPHGYILNFGNKRIYDPNGLIEEPLTDEDITNYFCCLGYNIGEKCAEYVKATVDSDEDDI